MGMVGVAGNCREMATQTPRTIPAPLNTHLLSSSHETIALICFFNVFHRRIELKIHKNAIKSVGVSGAK